MTRRDLADILGRDRKRSQDTKAALYKRPLGTRGRALVEVGGVEVEATSESGATWGTNTVVLVAKPTGREYVIVGGPPPGKQGASAHPVLAGASSRPLVPASPPPSLELTDGDWPPGIDFPLPPYNGTISGLTVALAAPAVLNGASSGEGFLEVVTNAGNRSTVAELLRSPQELGRPEWTDDPMCEIVGGSQPCWQGGFWQYIPGFDFCPLSDLCTGESTQDLQVAVINLARSVEMSEGNTYEVLPELVLHLRVRSVGGEVVLNNVITITRSVYLL